MAVVGMLVEGMVVERMKVMLGEEGGGGWR